MAKPAEFPKCLMIINGRMKFLSVKEASEAYNSGFGHVEFGEYVLAEDMSVSVMQDEYKKFVADYADKNSRKN